MPDGVNCACAHELTCGRELPFGRFGTLRVVIYDRVRAEPAVNVPQAHIIAEGNIISEAASFARQGKHHSRPGTGGARPQRAEGTYHARSAYHCRRQYHLPVRANITAEACRRSARQGKYHCGGLPPLRPSGQASFPTGCGRVSPVGSVKCFRLRRRSPPGTRTPPEIAHCTLLIAH